MVNEKKNLEDYMDDIKRIISVASSNLKALDGVKDAAEIYTPLVLKHFNEWVQNEVNSELVNPTYIGKADEARFDIRRGLWVIDCAPTFEGDEVVMLEGEDLKMIFDKYNKYVEKNDWVGMIDTSYMPIPE
jgi:hypothetical protein